MDEHDLGSLAYKLFNKRKELEAEEKRKAKIVNDKPNEPESPISYKEARSLQEEKKEHSNFLEKIENKIAYLKKEANNIENIIEAEIPTENADIKVSAKDQQGTHNYIINYVTEGSAKRIDLREE